MKKLLLVAAVAVALVSGCSRESVPPAHYGKILSGSGYSVELLPVGKYWIAAWSDLVLLEGSTTIVNLPLKVRMTEDQDGPSGTSIKVPGLNMDFILSLRYSIDPNEQVIQDMFNSLTIDPSVGLTAQQVFNTYASNIIQTSFKNYLAQYTPEQAYANRKVISESIGDELNKALGRNPIKISAAVITTFKLPEVISSRIDATKDTELQQAQENEQQKIELLKAKNSIALEEQESERKLVAAEGEAAANRALADGINDQVLALRNLELKGIYARAFAKHLPKAGNSLILPFDALNSTAGQIKAMQYGDK